MQKRSSPEQIVSKDNIAPVIVPEELQKKLVISLNELLHSCSDIRGAMICSIDGIAIAHAMPRDTHIDPAHFAAMSSSILALSDVMVSEANNGNARNVLVENEGGNLFVMHAGSTLLLMVIAKPKVNLGTSLAYARKLTEKIIMLKEQFD